MPVRPILGCERANTSLPCASTSLLGPPAHGVTTWTGNPGRVYQLGCLTCSSAKLTELCWRRVFCQLLRPDLDRVLAQQPPAGGPLVDLFYAVHQMEKKAQRFFPSALGARSMPASMLLPDNGPHGLYSTVRGALVAFLQS